MHDPSHVERPAKIFLDSFDQLINSNFIGNAFFTEKTNQDVMSAFEDMIPSYSPLMSTLPQSARSQFSDPWPQIARLTNIIENHLTK
jgi:hypothetical protein